MACARAPCSGRRRSPWNASSAPRGQGRVSGRPGGDRRVVRGGGPYCQSGPGDVVIVLRASVDARANTYSVSLTDPRGRYRDSLVRRDAIAWVRQAGFGPVDGPRPDARRLAAYVPLAVGNDADRLSFKP